jgi:acylphosphatase
VPSARAGVQASLRTHSDAQPTHVNSGSPSRICPAGRQSQTSWQGWAASVVTAPVCRPPLAWLDVDARLTVWVRGRVQGVGFRWWARTMALELGLDGWAANLDDGRVEVVAEGPREALEQLLAALGSGRTPGRVAALVHRWSDPVGVAPGFVER